MRFPALCAALLLALVTTGAPSVMTADDVAPDLVLAVQPLQWTALNPWTQQMELGNHCTASFINRKLNYWLTAAHCVASAENSDAGVGDAIADRDYAIGGVAAKVIYANFPDDVAVLQTEGYAFQPLKLAPHDIWWLTEIRMAGYPLGIGPFLVTGRVANPSWTYNGQDFYTLYDLSGCGGNSGSPVVNDHGEMIGVLQVGFGEPPCENLMGGAPWKNLKADVADYFGK